METEALSFHVCRYIISVGDLDLKYHGSGDKRKYRHLVDISKDIFALAGGAFAENEVEVDLWRYRY